jgi:ABC-type oligopeptide transport system substrate-binding subunit
MFRKMWTSFKSIDRQRFCAILLLLCSLLLIDGCDRNKHHSKKNLKIFKYNRTSGVSSTDPAFARDQSNIWVVNHLYNGLLQLDNQLNVQAGIAKSWTISPDGLTYTFYLRDDVYFVDNLNGKSKLCSIYRANVKKLVPTTNVQRLK